MDFQLQLRIIIIFINVVTIRSPAGTGGSGSGSGSSGGNGKPRAAEPASTSPHVSDTGGASASSAPDVSDWPDEGGLVAVSLPRATIQQIDTVDNQASDLTDHSGICLLYTSPSPRDLSTSRMPSSA